MNKGVVFFLASLASTGLAHAGTPGLPIIPAYTTNVTQAPYYAKGDGTTDNTLSISNAIYDVNKRGGGTVLIPGQSSNYLSGPLTMRNNINLQIGAGATLRMKPYGSWPGTSPLLSCTSLSNIELSGEGGIDGQGWDWWAVNAGSGLYMIYFSNCNTVLVQNVTVSNAPKQQVVFKGKNGNITFTNVTIRAPSSHVSTPSHNTDGIDLVGTNCLIQDCTISTGDDNIALGTSSSGTPAANIVVTNCNFGDGHGMTIGGNTGGGVSNLTVVHCFFTNTDYGIRMKSDNNTSSPGAGGIVQNLNYSDLYMSNMRYFPIAIHSYYNEDSDPTGITPSTAAGMQIDPATANTVVWRDITISNLTAVGGNGEAGIIWGRTELPVTNVTLLNVHITAPSNFNLYNVYGVQFVDSTITVSGSDKTFSLYNAGLTITNSAPTNTVFSLDGLAGTNSLALYNTRSTMSDSALLGVNPLTLGASTLSNSTGVTLPAASVVNFVVGTTDAAVAVSGNLSLGSTLNITAGDGFGPGTNTLFNYTGSLSGTPVLGTKPPGYIYSLDTTTPKQVNLVVSSTNSPPTITNQPAGLNVLVGSNAVFTVGAAGTAPLSYQWWFNATNRPAGGTNSSLTVTNAQPTNAGSYTVIVTNTAGSATSSVAVLQVFATAAPTLISGSLLSNGQFSFGVTGVPGFNYAVLASTNLVNWLGLATNAAPFIFTDPAAPPFPSRFYRAAYWQ